MDAIWWLIALGIMAVGLLGTVLPAVPGTTVILGAAILHRVMVGPEQGMGWWGFGALALLTLISYGIEFLSGYFGAKRFGATRWGVIGAVIGGIAGLFTGFITLLVLPIVGAVVGELIGGKQLVAAGKAGWGTLLGNLAGMVGKFMVAVAMICWWLVEVPSPSDALRRVFKGVSSARWQMIAGEPQGLLEESPNTTRQHAA